MGRAGAGKTYLADELLTYLDSGTKLSFAAQLRREIEYVMGADCPKLWEKPTSPEIRFILQQYGTEFRRAQDTDYWVHKGMQEAYVQGKLGHIVIFDDVRFKNEAAAIRNEGGVLVRVETPAAIRKKRLGELPPEHASETSVDNEQAEFTVPGMQGALHDMALRSILVDVTYNEIDFLELIHESLN